MECSEEEPYRKIEAGLMQFIDAVISERSALTERLDEAIARAGGEIRYMMWIAVLAGLIVAAVTIWEIKRSFR